jgi:ATP-binding cassette subfamily B protein
MLGLGSIALLAGTACNLAGPWLIARAIDVDFANADLNGLIFSAVTYLVCLMGNAGFTYAGRMALEVVGQRAMYDLKTKIFDHLIHHDLAYHDTQNSGRLITRVQGDTEALRVLFSEVILAFPADFCLVVGMFVVLGNTAPDIAPFVFAVLPPYVLLLLLFRHVSPPRFLAVRGIVARLTGFFAEHLRAMPVLRLFDREQWLYERAEELNGKVFRAQTIARLHTVWYFNACFLVRSLGMVLILWIGAGQVANEIITIGALVMALGYLRQMFSPLMRLSFQFTTIERARAAAIRIAQILDTPRTIVGPPEPKAWPGLRTGVRLEEVRFHYEEGNEVLRGIDMEIPAGANVGIVGSTGSGKSTIVNMLLRFRDPNQGRVTIDGVDIRELSVDELRRRSGLVLQDVHLFAGTLLDNLGGDAEAATRALATLGISHFDLSEELTEGGGNLSRGERQLLTFARALVDEPEFLVLDEATSAIDPETEAHVQRAMEQLQTGRTTVTVAHRLATIRHCDRIYVLGDGEVRESGDHEQLMALDGIYANLTRLQAGAA